MPLRNTLMKTTITLWFLAIPWTFQQDAESFQEGKQEAREQMILANSSKIVEILLSTNDATTYSISDALTTIPENLWDQELIFKLPLAPFFATYEVTIQGKPRKMPHPLTWHDKNFGMLVGYNQVDSIVTKYAQSGRENITGLTKYEISDTLTFPAVYPGLDQEFPQKLDTLLQSAPFNTLTINKGVLPQMKNFYTLTKQTEKDAASEYKTYTTDPAIVLAIKKTQEKRSAMALYKDGRLLLATHVSLGVSTPSGIFLTGFSVESQHLDYRRSTKYSSAPMAFSFNILGGVYGHARWADGQNRSYGCLGMPWAYAMIIQSLVKDGHVPVYMTTK